jgi:hypothetical protein
MVLNKKSWELVKDGSFIVGDRALVKNGVTFHPGEDYPSGDRSLFALYDNNQITDKPETATKSKKKRKA